MILRILLLGSILVVFYACGPEKTSGNKDEKGDKEINNKQVSGIKEEELLKEGKKIYQMYCIACHQADGSGVPGNFPPVAKNPTVTGDLNKLVTIILKGQSGPIEVNGEFYNNVMTPHGFLTDKQIAGVITYIRKNFANEGEPVYPEEIKKIRNAVQ